MEHDVTTRFNEAEWAVVKAYLERTGLSAYSLLRQAALEYVTTKEMKAAKEDITNYGKGTADVGPSEDAILEWLHTTGRKDKTERQNIDWVVGRFHVTAARARKLVRIFREGNP